MPEPEHVFAVHCVVRKIRASENRWSTTYRVIFFKIVCVINSFIMRCHNAVVCSIVAEVYRRDSVEDCCHYPGQELEGRQLGGKIFVKKEM